MNYFIAKRRMFLLLISSISLGSSTHCMKDRPLSLFDFPQEIREYTTQLSLEYTHGSNFELFKEITLGEELTSAAVSSDGKTVLTATKSGTVSVWDIETEKTLFQVNVGETNFVALAFSPDGKSFLTGSKHGETILWDRKTGKQLQQFYLNYYPFPIFSVAFSPKSDFVLTGSGEEVHVWNVQTGQQVKQLANEERSVYFVEWSPYEDGKTVVILTGFTIQIVDRISGALLKELKWSNLKVNSLAVSSDGKFILASQDGKARLWNVVTQGVEKIFKIDKKIGISSVAFSPDDKRVLLGVEDGTIFVGETATGQLLKELKGPHEKLILKVAFSEDGQHIISVSEDGKIAQWGRRIEFSSWKEGMKNPAKELFVSKLYEPLGRGTLPKSTEPS